MEPVQKGVELTPHRIAQRYGEFAHSVLALQDSSDPSMSDEMLLMNLRLLRVEAERVILLLADQVPSGKPRLVFKINNFDAVVSALLAQGTAEGGCWPVMCALSALL